MRRLQIAMKRWPQIVLIVATMALAWWGMMIAHEAGHVLGAWCTGGQVRRVVLSPLAFSRTDLSVNPHPLLVAWSGAWVGVLLPLMLWGAARWWRWSAWPVLRFVAGFGLIANGAYLAFGMFDRAGDAGDLLKLGAARWQLGWFGAVTMPLGLYLRNGLGRHFGIGPGAAPVSARAAGVTLGVVLLIVAAELAWSG